MRFLIDMNLTPRWAGFLVEAGYESIHWSAVGPPNAKDSEICGYARSHGYVILTNDLDFPQILAHTRDAGPSVILLRGEPLVPETRGSALLRAIDRCKEEIGPRRHRHTRLAGPAARKSASVTISPGTQPFYPIQCHESSVYLRTNEREKLNADGPFTTENRLEDYLIRHLVDYDDINYDDRTLRNPHARPATSPGFFCLTIRTDTSPELPRILHYGVFTYSSEQ